MSDVDERDKVDAWRREWFLELTKSERQTEWLLAIGADPHDLDDLFKAGCPWKLAKRILAPV